MDYDGNKLFESLVGETLTSIEGLSQYSEEVYFTTASGRRFKMYHSQDCCESVSLEDFEFDAGLLQHPIISAVVEVSDEFEGAAPTETEYGPDSQTYTFYRLASLGGSLYLRWYGSSNGYYSESVTFAELS